MFGFSCAGSWPSSARRRTLVVQQLWLPPFSVLWLWIVHARSEGAFLAFIDPETLASFSVGRYLNKPPIYGYILVVSIRYKLFPKDLVKCSYRVLVFSFFFSAQFSFSRLYMLYSIMTLLYNIYLSFTSTGISCAHISEAPPKVTNTLIGLIPLKWPSLYNYLQRFLVSPVAS